MRGIYIFEQRQCRRIWAYGLINRLLKRSPIVFHYTLQVLGMNMLGIYVLQIEAKRLVALLNFC